MRKAAATAVLAAALSVAAAGTALADWNQDGNGWWYEYEDGRYAKSGIKEIGGKRYCFDDQGYMKTGWQYVNWKWYYFEGDGSQASGWRQLDGKWYYLDPKDENAMYTYWLDLPDASNKNKINRYYLDENGVMQTGIFYLSEGTSGENYAYQADENGVLIRNKTVKNGDTEIRYNENGMIMFRNSQTIRDSIYNGTDEWQYLLSQSEIEDIAQEEAQE